MRLRPSTIWIYGSVGLPLAMIGYPIGVFLPDLYHRELGLALPAIGLMLMLARLSDAVTDPVMGFMSDSIETRFARRSESDSGPSRIPPRHPQAPRNAARAAKAVGLREGG